MALFDAHLLSIVVFAPLMLGVIGLFMPAAGAKWNALVASLITLGVSVVVYMQYDPAGAEFQMMEKNEWIPAMGVRYLLGIDGISLVLVLLTTLLMPIVILGAFKAVEQREKEFYFFLLALESGILGAFAALDLFLFYVFWEAMLVPMYFLIGIWGGKERTYAAMKFFIYTAAGSLLMLVAIFYLTYQHKLQFAEYSTALPDLYRLQLASTGGMFSVQSLLFLAFALAFAIKVPLFPLHTWLPDAHVQAPTAGSVVLAGVLLKLGGYGFIRIAFPLFPAAVAQHQYAALCLGAVAILYGAWVAMIQPDIKKLVAYSSVSHMGYVIIGLFSLTTLGASGAVYQMLNHGVSTGALFLLVGMIYERRHTREIEAFGGITKTMPLFAVIFLIVTLSSIALPGTNGFVGEFLILLGTWESNRVIAAVAALGVVFGAVYMLWMFQRVMFGPIKHDENKSLKDLSFRELLVLAPLVVAIFAMGVFPNPILKKMQPSVDRFLAKSVPGGVPVQQSAFSMNFLSDGESK